MRDVALAGATGLVGREILEGLLADANVATIHVVARRALGREHPKIAQHIVNFAQPLALPAVAETYLALGTTIKVAGSEAAFRAVDYEANFAVARAAHASGCRRIGLVSAMGSDVNSKLFYSRVKGELEDALSKLPLDAFVIARPSLLVGDRTALGQPERRGERLGMRLDGVIGALFPANYRPIPARSVARALLANVPVAQGKQILLSGAMRKGDR